MKRKKIYIIPLFIFFFSIMISNKVYADGIVGTAAAQLPPSKGGPVVEDKGTYIDTSEWVKKTKTRRYWVPGSSGNGSSNGNGNGTGAAGTEGHWETESYVTWELKSNGFYAKDHGDIDIKLDEAYIFTQNNKKENGEPAGLHYKVDVKNLRCTTNVKTFPAEILSLNVYHNVNRYQNKGIYIPKKVKSETSLNGTTGFSNGKFEYKYAGDDKSSFGVSGELKSKVTYRTAGRLPGTYVYKTKVVYRYFGTSYLMPVNAFNAVNYTGHKNRQTDLIFKRCPAGTNITYTW